jgi:amino-acid N-acetyltransferase
MPRPDDLLIEAASPDDLEPVKRLVRRSDLPLEGLDELVATLIVARQHGAVVGCAALELFGLAALLRSVAVDEAARGHGVGIAVTEAALASAGSHGCQRIYLLTESAEHFFSRFGFRRISRWDVEAAVQQSLEFTTLCPESAVVMCCEINEAPANSPGPSNRPPSTAR